jgi:hypothetical protein
VDYEPEKEAIERLDVDTGRAVFRPSGTPPQPENLPLNLSKAVAA